MAASVRPGQQSATQPVRPLHQVFADLRAEFLAVAKEIKHLTVLVVKHADGLVTPAVHLQQMKRGRLVIKDKFGPSERVSQGRSESQRVVCVGTGEAVRRYERLAAAAGQALPLDRFVPEPVLPTEDHVRAIGHMSIWTGFVFNQLRPLGRGGFAVPIRENVLDRDPKTLKVPGLTVEWAEEYDDGDSGPPREPRSTYAWIGGNMFTASALAIADSGLLDRVPGEQPDGPVTADGRSFRVQGQVYTFTAQQAAIIMYFWKSRGIGVTELAGGTVLDEVDSNSGRFKYAFQVKGSVMHPAWQVLFRKGERRGTYILNVPNC